METKTIKEMYQKRVSKFNKMKEEVIYIIKEKLDLENIAIHLIDGRIKTIDSIINKMQKDGIDLSDKIYTTELFDLITDICGVRIICLFMSDLSKICEIMEKTFNIQVKNNKIESKAYEEFGYLSIHYVCKLPKSFHGSRYDDIKDLCFELQIRTIAMHSWATISHYLDYKTINSIPSNLRKEFQALSALFYIADSLFEKFFQAGEKSKEIAESTTDRIEKRKDNEINLDTLSAFLKLKYPDRFNYDPDNISLLIDELVKAEYKSINDIEKDLDRAKEAFEYYEKKHPPTSEQGNKEIYADIGVVRVSLSIVNEKFMKARPISPGLQNDYIDARKHLKKS